MLIAMLESLQLVYLAGRVSQMLITLLESLDYVIGVFSQHAGVNRQKSVICTCSLMYCSKQ